MPKLHDAADHHLLQISAEIWVWLESVGRRIPLDIPCNTRELNVGNQYSTSISHSHTQTSRFYIRFP